MFCRCFSHTVVDVTVWVSPKRYAALANRYVDGLVQDYIIPSALAMEKTTVLHRAIVVQNIL